MAYLVTLVPSSTAGGKAEGGAATLDLIKELEDSGALEGADSEHWLWRFGDARIDIKLPAGNAGQQGEVEVAFSFAMNPDDAGEAIRILIEAAEKNLFRAFDPQIGRSVGKGDASLIASRFEAASSYHMHYAGPGDVLAYEKVSAGSQKESFPSPRARALMVTVGALIVVYLILRAVVINPLLDSFSITSEPELERPSGPPPGWLDRHPPPQRGS